MLPFSQPQSQEHRGNLSGRFPATISPNFLAELLSQRKLLGINSSEKWFLHCGTQQKKHKKKNTDYKGDKTRIKRKKLHLLNITAEQEKKNAEANRKVMRRQFGHRTSAKSTHSPPCPSAQTYQTCWHKSSSRSVSVLLFYFGKELFGLRLVCLMVQAVQQPRSRFWLSRVHQCPVRP